MKHYFPKPLGKSRHYVYWLDYFDLVRMWLKIAPSYYCLRFRAFLLGIDIDD